MIRILNKTFFYVFIIIFLCLFGCSHKPITGPYGENQEVLFDSTGLVDSVVVNGCYEQLDMFFVNNINTASYSYLRIDFDGYTNSNGSFVELLYDCDTASHVLIYHMKDINEVNKLHSLSINIPSDNINIELRIYIFPPVCGTGEFKYTRVRDLKIYGIN